MAEFKLSRIRFNWKGEWAGGTDYIVDDMISYKGSTYVSLRTHSSITFANDLAGTDVTPAKPKWAKQSEGVVWTGDWATSTEYAIGSIVKYGASIYQCTENHTSAATFVSGTDGLVADIGKWKIVAVSSADWKNNWTVNTLYRINDLVRYNGKVYKATAQHVSAANTDLGLEADQSSWEVLADSDTWRADWSIGTRYTENDIVKYGGIVYKCITGHTSADNATQGLEEDQSKWTIQIDGIEYVTATLDDDTISGAWQESYRYKKNDIVKRGGNLVKCLIGHTSGAGDQAFNIDYNTNNYWTIYLPGQEYESVWDETEYYQPGDLVLQGGYIYKSLTFNTNATPGTSPLDWNLTFEGYKFRYDWNNPGASDDSTVTDYYTGDLVRLSGSLYIAIQNNTNLQPDLYPDYWEKVVEARQFRNTWEDDQEYFQGDIVTRAGTSYVCLQYHRSTESASRPDLDINQPDNNYWKIMILGTQTNKLAKLGDLKTFQDQDSTDIDTLRLGIGTTGQGLRVTSGMPSWDSLDKHDKVYYVSRDGIDDASQGTTLNAPWRTIRFAMNYLLADETNRVGAGATVQVMGGEFREILPISIPSKVALKGSELRTTTVRPAENTDVILGERTVDNPNPEAISVPADNVRRNMFYVRNGCGIRQLTLRGLEGTLGADNDYGTKRPIPGNAFVSLDPGTGPDDESVWVTNKSTYVQGVTTIGTACVGMKIDGGLHNGGNRSIVANDFTQVISDGIGYWATNLGRSELVSVFTYYCHIGYLAENGGILRATNGNNSYGKFGSVSEGFDNNETPQIVTVDNRTGDASVTDFVGGGGPVLALGYGNNGQTYTSATASLTNASGNDLDIRYDEIRDSAISKIDLALPDDSTNVGGNGFKNAQNSAQSGDLTTIVLAASETRTKEQLLGMRIIIIEGPGVGQYGYIQNYSPGTKTVTVYRDSDNQPGWDNIVPGKDNVLAITGASIYAYEPRVTIEAPTFTKADRNVNIGSHDIGYSDTLGLWYYAPTGQDKFFVSSDTSVWTERDTPYSLSYVSFAKKGPLLLGLADGTNLLPFSNDGITWDHSTLPLNTTWKKIAVGGANTDTIMCLATGNANIYINTIDAGEDSSSVPSGNWTTVATGATDTDWVGLAYGAGKWIAISEDGTTVTSADNGVTWSSGAAVTPSSPEVYNDLVFGNNAWVATMAQSDRIIYSSDGSSWSDSQLVGDSGREDWVVGYSGGVFLATSGTGTTLSSENAKYWVTRDANGGMGNVAGGILSNIPTFVTINETSTTANVYTGGARAWARAVVATGKLSQIKIYDPGSGYITTPTVTVEDPEEYGEPYFTVEVSNGVLPQPIFYNRGTGYQSVTIKLSGDGFGEELQIGNTMTVTGIGVLPGPGANVVFAGNSTTYRLVKIVSSSGVAPNITIKFQISPVLSRTTAPLHGVSTTIRERYSSCRLTGHDFLDIGTGNFGDTNYPALYVEGQNSVNEGRQANEVVESNGGRVFYTSTDQDGNFRVGELFRVSQAQGGVTLSADFFDLEGLDEIRLGGIRVGGTQAVIREFSTDNTFVASTDNIIPTQRALKTYIENRFTGGGSNLFTNELTAGQLKFSESTWSNTAGSNTPDAMASVDVLMKINGSLGGGLAALNMFMSGRTERDDFNG